jgi:hypothetical protein
VHSFPPFPHSPLPPHPPTLPLTNPRTHAPTRPRSFPAPYKRPEVYLRTPRLSGLSRRSTGGALMFGDNNHSSSMTELSSFSLGPRSKVCEGKVGAKAYAHTFF